jgi:sulfonate transport system substrate-binding protein
MKNKMTCGRTQQSKTTQSLAALFMAALALVITTSCTKIDNRQPIGAEGSTGQEKPIQVGWMTSWATAGQIINSMIHTNISALYGAPLIFRSFLFGPDINEAALHGEVDCANNGLVPTISLLAASPDWVIVARLSEGPLSIVARKGSNIKTIADLKGKSVAVPFGGGSHPFLLQKLEDAHLQIGDGPDKVNLVNLKPDDQAVAMQQGSVDAVGTWEPQTAIMVARGVGDVIDRERHLGVITVRKSIAAKHPEAIVRLLKCYMEASYFVAGHQDEAYKWYATTARLDENVRKYITEIEPNLKAKSAKDINIDLTTKDLALGQRFADTMLKAELIPAAVDFRGRTDLTYLETAKKELAAEGFRTSEVKEVPSEAK